MASKIIKNSCNAGELSEYISGRTDIVKYYNGCSVLTNAVVLPEGGAVKRSGTEFIAKSKEFSEWDNEVLYPAGCVVRATVDDVESYYYCDTANTSSASPDTITDDIAHWTLVETANDSKIKLFGFEFSVSDAHILEFGTRYMRVYKNGARIFEAAQDIEAIALVGVTPANIQITAHGYLTGDTVKFTAVNGGCTALNGKEFVITKVDADNFTLDGTDSSDYTAWDDEGNAKKIYEITTPFDSSDIFEIHTAQCADVMYEAHEDYWPRKLSRLADASWTLAEVVFKGGPFLTENTTSTKLLKFTADGVQTGAHDGGDNKAKLTDSGEAWTVDQFVGLSVYNVTDGSSGTITANDATTVTAALAGGTENDWDDGDVYTIGYNGYYFEPGCIGTLTATAHTPFNALHVGSLWLLKNTREDNTTGEIVNAAAAATESDPIRIKGDYILECANFNTDDWVELWRKEGNGEYQLVEHFTAATSYSSTEEIDDVFYKIKVQDILNASALKATLTAKDQVSRGVVKVTEFTNTTTVSVTVVDAVYRPGAAGAVSPDKSMWAEGAFSDYRGFPRTVSFHENRLDWASSTNNPQTKWGSKINDFENHTTGPNDDDATAFTLNENDVSQIQWIASKQSMIVGTAQSEFILGAANPNDAMTPSDIKAIKQSTLGSNNIQPVELNNALFFFQRQGRKARAMRYTYDIDAQESKNATLLAKHILLDSPPTCMAIQLVPDSILWVTREDGTLCASVYEPSEEIDWAWSRIITGSTLDVPVGYFESCAVIHGTNEDELWVSVKRIINGSTYRYIERFAERLINQPDEAMMLDGAVRVESAYEAQHILLASDTVRCGSGLCGSSLCGGVPA